MQFLHDIRKHVKDFESQASNEIHRFLDFLLEKYETMQPKPAVVAPPQPPVADAGTSTPVVAPEPVAAPVVDAPATAPVAANAAAPVAPAPAADPVPAAPVADGTAVVTDPV